MKKAVKTSVWIVGGLLALLAAAALFIVLTFDPNKYKAEIAAAVSQATGRELTISGDIRLPLFPWLGVELGAMELSNAPGFGSEPFVSITSAAVKVKLLPLLRKEVQAEAVTLTGLRLHLRRDAAGRNNWADLVAASKGEATPAPGVSSAAPVLGLNATGNLHGHDLLTTARYDGTLDIAGSDLRGTLKQLAITPVTADAQVLPALRGRVQFSYSGNTAVLDDIVRKLDQTTLMGCASGRDFAKPAVRFQLALDSIDADRFLPPPAPKATPVAAPPSAAAAAGAAALPLATLRKLYVDGKLRIGALKVAKLKLSDIDMALSARDGVIRLY